eukprot:TRINITY_DN9202_c0_g1_i1.p1 TRINITY_DN9202_c0_g1~~TRINITY_DN9202_c0_g1_i1.p1  ORF type:complete len:990 (-),score=168.40 TRINITY_DN9202_c0_g1_i1:108-3077(-)
MSSPKRRDRSRSPKRTKPFREEKQSREADLDDEISADALERVLFRTDDCFPRGSKDYVMFKDFYRKYRTHASKTPEGNRKSSTAAKVERDEPSIPEEIRSLPQEYDLRYRMNFALLTDHTTERSQHILKRASISSESVSQIRHAMHLFQDFRNKQAIQKAKQIQKSRSNLPIASYEDEIVKLVQENQVVLIAGDTGCGKSTQVPQILMKAGFRRMACTQPRRIATMSLCRRVAVESLNAYGSQVAYQIRFDTTQSRETRIIFMTEGILLRQVAGDPLLSSYDVIIIDEVHERHLQVDFLLAILRSIIPQRPDLKLILMSATINLDLYSSYFWNCPVVKVPGRLFPIKVEYISLANERPASSVKKGTAPPKKSFLDPGPYLRILEKIDKEYPTTERGDCLVFVSGIAEIDTLVEQIASASETSKSWIALPLHSALSVDDQEKVFDQPPEGMRKCIVSTNIAETSVTIDGIRFVIDSGKAKELTYDVVTNMQTLQETWISRASAEQRKGRAGRTGPGVAFRLYSSAHFEEMEDYPIPEIRRIPLHSTVLQIMSLELGDPRNFSFIDPPPADTIESAIFQLKQAEALTNDSRETVTSLGRVLSQLPVDINLGKILILGSICNLLDPTMILAAALSVQSPLLRTSNPDAQSCYASERQSFESKFGDPFTLYFIYMEWLHMKERSQESSKKWCRRKGLEEQRLYEMTKLRRQLRSVLPESLRDYELEEKKSKKARIEHGMKRRELRNMIMEREQSRGKRVLQLPTEDDAEEREKQEDADVLDMEFKLSSTDDTFSISSRNLHRRDINILIFILCSSMYPNYALPDEANASLKDSDKIYHTLQKPMVCMHPTSIFSTSPDLIGRNAILFYERLFQTNKPYLTNVLVAPALQVLLLICISVDTNAECTSLIIDEWINIRMYPADLAQSVIAKACRLRGLLTRFLASRLDGDDNLKLHGLREEMFDAPAFVRDFVLSYRSDDVDPIQFTGWSSIYNS